jgi:hypothetical protein
LFRKALTAASSVEPKDSNAAPGKIRIAISGVGPERLAEIECREVRRKQARRRILQKYQGRYANRAVIATSKLDCPNRTIVGLTRRSVRRLLGRIVRQDGEILRLLTILDFTEALGSDTALEQLAYGGCPARHSPCKSPGVNDPQFLVREHDLKPLASVEFTHVPLREPTLRAVLRRHVNAKSPK